MARIDPNTGRPFGDHGTAQDAIDYAIDVEGREQDPRTFLCRWREGDLDEWPEYYAWLAMREAKKRPI